MSDRETDIRLLAEQAVQLKHRIEALGLPRADKSRMLLEYELTKVRLRIRDLKRMLPKTARPRRLIPYAGAERD